MSDFDEAHGTLSVTKARVYGIDKLTTKTHEDRVVEPCPPAIAVLKRQLGLYRRLKARGRIDHDQLFFNSSGAPIHCLGQVAMCWRKSSDRLGLRFRRPYCARHTSVSWNLIIGKRALLVSRQHGHSMITMFRAYAAWMDGATESDIPIIQSAMNSERSAAEWACSQELRPETAPVAKLGTGLVSGSLEPKQQLSKIKAKLKWRKGWDWNCHQHVPSVSIQLRLVASMLISPRK